MTLVGLDDARVDKDPSQSGQHDELVPRTLTGGSVLPPRTTTGGYDLERLGRALGAAFRRITGR